VHDATARPGRSALAARIPAALTGRVTVEEFDSSALAGNPLRDPARRSLLLYRSPDARPGSPTVVVLHGAMTDLTCWVDRRNDGATTLQSVTTAVERAGLGAHLAFVDAGTRLGGSQYLDSPGIGNYHRYLVEDVVDAAAAILGVTSTRWGVVGHSSGGFGALHAALGDPGRFPVVGSVSGDLLFEAGHWATAMTATRTLQRRFDASYAAFRSWLAHRTGGWDSLDEGEFACAEQVMLHAAHGGSIDEPLLDPLTGRFDRDVWRRWLVLDPVRIAAQRPAEARALRYVHLEAGDQDPYHADIGMQAMHAALASVGVRTTARRFAGGHHDDAAISRAVVACVSALH
jgi:S-formylglutathione hydrolase FrmB